MVQFNNSGYFKFAIHIVHDYYVYKFTTTDEVNVHLHSTLMIVVGILSTIRNLASYSTYLMQFGTF